MKSDVITVVKILLLLLTFGSGPVFGQEPRLRLDSLDRLAAQAIETIDVNVDGAILKLVPQIMLGARSPGPARFKELIDGLKGIYVKRFEFDKEGGYTAEDVETIRAQLRPPAWTRVVGVRTGRGREHVEAYIMSEGNNITGVTVISAEPKELIVANVIGVIDIEKLAELFREIDLPWLEWTGSDKREKE